MRQARNYFLTSFAEKRGGGRAKGGGNRFYCREIASPMRRKSREMVEDASEAIALLDKKTGLYLYIRRDKRRNFNHFYTIFTSRALDSKRAL